MIHLFIGQASKKAPILLIHGEDDENSGTHLMQSERLFHALRGLGGVARFVKLPRERHSYRARESILHTMYEQDEWLRRHVEEARSSSSSSSSGGSSSSSSSSGKARHTRLRRAVTLLTVLVAGGGAWAIASRRPRL